MEPWLTLIIDLKNNSCELNCFSLFFFKELQSSKYVALVFVLALCDRWRNFKPRPQNRILATLRGSLRIFYKHPVLFSSFLFMSPEPPRPPPGNSITDNRCSVFIQDVRHERWPSSIMSELAGVAITTVFSILVTVDLVGNSLVCLVITINRDMRYSRTIH